jgi:hypothetical protein
MSATARLFRRFIDRTDEINWEEVYTDQLPRVYNYFRYRFGDDMQYNLSSSAGDISTEDPIKIAELIP